MLTLFKERLRPADYTIPEKKIRIAQLVNKSIVSDQLLFLVSWQILSTHFSFHIAVIIKLSLTDVWSMLKDFGN